MTITDQRDLVIPEYYAALLRERVAVERAIAEELAAVSAGLTANGDHADPRWLQYDKVSRRLDLAARDVALTVRLMLDRLDAEGHPA